MLRRVNSVPPLPADVKLTVARDALHIRGHQGNRYRGGAAPWRRRPSDAPLKAGGWPVASGEVRIRQRRQPCG